MNIWVIDRLTVAGIEFTYHKTEFDETGKKTGRFKMTMPLVCPFENFPEKLRKEIEAFLLQSLKEE